MSDSPRWNEAAADEWGTPRAINMDIDDINIPMEATDRQGSPEPEDDTVRPSGVVLNHLLQRSGSGVGNWTHLVKRPDVFRCNVTDIRDAGELWRGIRVHADPSAHRAVWRYADSGLSVMERRLSPIARIAIEVRLPAHSVISTVIAERSFIRQLLAVVSVNLKDICTRNGVPQDALTAFVLRPPSLSGNQVYWFHWPALATSCKEFTADWCSTHWDRVAMPTAGIEARRRECVERTV